MDKTNFSRPVSRRLFAATAAGAGFAAALPGEKTPKQVTQDSVPGDPDAPGVQYGTQPEKLPFDEPLHFERRDAVPRVQTFPLSDVQLLPSVFQQAREANRRFLHNLPADRLLHDFRVNAGLPSTAQPLGGWEKPDCEVRGHFVGHYLSACALMYASTGDRELKARGDLIVGELAKCRQRLGGEYLSAFPVEFFDRLAARRPVWAPFYTIHKIMAGMLDMHQQAGNAEALQVLKGMADWVDKWTAGLLEGQMQMVLDTEYGGMNEVLYNLAAVTGEDRYANAGDRFTRKRFFNPLALRRDELRGLHANTHIPQVMGAARRYELSSDRRFYNVATTFWENIVSSRTYATGGTSNNEGWLVEPNLLAKELTLGAATNECCCAYNMLKLTRALFTWMADPRYFDYYERVLYNHRLGTIDLQTGLTQYYLGLVPGSWRTFAVEYDTFWCCTGTGVEEYSKLNDSIYFHDDNGVYVNLFIPSELNWKARNVRIRQTANFPEAPETSLKLLTERPLSFAMHIRIPAWVEGLAQVSVNGKPVEFSATPGSYLTIARNWNDGDSVSVRLPMRIRAESMPDDPELQAFLYGPLLLAAELGGEVDSKLVLNAMGPDLKKRPAERVPAFQAHPGGPPQWITPAGEPLHFRTPGQQTGVALKPFYEIGAGRAYSVYWRVRSG